MLDTTPNQPVKFRTINWIEINDGKWLNGNYCTNSQVKLKTSMLKSSSLCDYSDAYVLATGTITVPNTGTAANENNRKNMIIKNYAPFTEYISEIDNTQICNAKYIDVAMLMYNLIEYSDNYSKIWGRL